MSKNFVMELGIFLNRLSDKDEMYLYFNSNFKNKKNVYEESVNEILDNIQNKKMKYSIFSPPLSTPDDHLYINDKDLKLQKTITNPIDINLVKNVILCSEESKQVPLYSLNQLIERNQNTNEETDAQMKNSHGSHDIENKSSNNSVLSAINQTETLENSQKSLRQNTNEHMSDKNIDSTKNLDPLTNQINAFPTNSIEEKRNGTQDVVTTSTYGLEISTQPSLTPPSTLNIPTPPPMPTTKPNVPSPSSIPTTASKIPTPPPLPTSLINTQTFLSNDDINQIEKNKNVEIEVVELRKKTNPQESVNVNFIDPNILQNMRKKLKSFDRTKIEFSPQITDPLYIRLSNRISAISGDEESKESVLDDDWA